MKRKVYKSELEEYVEMEVVAQYKFLGETYGVESLTNGKIYDCVGYDDTMKMGRIVDDSGEDYLYVLDKFELIVNYKEKIADENEETLFYYILVSYEDYSGYREYNYISNDKSVKAGDRVLVDRAGKLAVAEVLETGYFNKYNSPFPVDKTKRIIKKVDEDFQIEDIECYDGWDEEENNSFIKMNIDDTYFEFGVDGHVKDGDNDDWANIRIKVRNSYFQYFRKSELMTSAEIENLFKKLKLLLDNEIKEKLEITFYEPDLEFILYPKINLWDTGKYTYIKDGHEIQDVYIELNINLTDKEGAYTGQKYVMIFNREETEIIIDYIKSVLGK